MKKITPLLLLVKNKRRFDDESSCSSQPVYFHFGGKQAHSVVVDKPG